MNLDNSTWEKFWQSRYNQLYWDQNYNIQGFGHQNDSDYRSDISALLPIIEFITRECDHSTELGCRHCFSTSALLKTTKKRVVSYDVAKTQDMTDLERLRDRGELPTDWELKLISSIDPNHTIEETDFLFVDTRHSYTQVKAELELHAHRVRKYIGFHDYFTDYAESLDCGGVGIGPAIEEFLAKGEFRPVLSVPYNHGMLIIERVV